MKKIILIFIFNFLWIKIFSYELNKNINIRFGIPFIGGKILYKKGFVLLYDKNKKVPLWVSYHLTKKYYNEKQKKVYFFSPDPELKKGERAEFEDYNKTIYTLCSLAPIDDMARDKEMMKEAFYFSNVCPMDKELYNNCWKKLENIIRNFVKSGNDVWVVTGPLFLKKQHNIKKIGKNKIYVPTHFYKLILYQRKNKSFGASAYIFENKRCKNIENNLTTINDIEKITNYDFFNLLPEYVQNLVESQKKPL